jgi:oligoendopeptidase F
MESRTGSKSTLTWEQVDPHFKELNEQSLDQENLEAWLARWSRLAELVAEYGNQLYVATSVNIEDKEAEESYNDFLDNILPQAIAADQALKEKLLKSGLEPDGFEVQMRMMRAESDLFREDNLVLLTEEAKLVKEYDKIAGLQTVEWDGEEITLPRLLPVYHETDRSRREKAWRLAAQRQLDDRAAYNALWQKLLPLRGRLAENASRPDYRAYRWQQLNRFDYTSDDARRFQDSIEQVVVPAAARLYDKRRQLLGLDSLRPWDLYVDPKSRPPLKPFSEAAELVEKVHGIFDRVDPQLGAYFQIMRDKHLLDLENRKGKAPGGYCISFPVERIPFIFMNAVGLHDDVQTLLHEGGHAFHVFETARLPYYHQLNIGAEIAEVASMSMELLAAPYLESSQGGFYSPEDAARARIEHLSNIILFWPYMAVVDAFQHWVYTNPDKAMVPENCDVRWSELWDRFMPGIDYRGLEEVKATGWHRKLHIFHYPFYYIEYGLAQLGAVQVWRNALQDQARAVADYRNALSLGATRPLPELFKSAGGRFALDTRTLQEAIELVEATLDQLETAGG